MIKHLEKIEEPLIKTIERPEKTEEHHEKIVEPLIGTAQHRPKIVERRRASSLVPD